VLGFSASCYASPELLGEEEEHHAQGVLLVLEIMQSEWWCFLLRSTPSQLGHRDARCDSARLPNLPLLGVRLLQQSSPNMAGWLIQISKRIRSAQLYENKYMDGTHYVHAFFWW
jgi:hypothetical protein